MNYRFSEMVNYDINIWILFVNDKLPCVCCKRPCNSTGKEIMKIKKRPMPGDWENT
jgi:alanine-alpha-ketoisovalerate/valine-pyruvate aminotransferase